MVSQPLDQTSLPLEQHLLNAPTPPVINSRYAVMRLIGHGSRAQVFLSWDLNTQRWCAVKALLFPSDETEHCQFTAAGEVLRSLSHQNLLPVWDVGMDKTSGLRFIVTALARGGSLDDLLARLGVLPPREAILRLVEVCNAMVEAHERGVVHQNLKPSNLLLNDKNQLMVADFGDPKSKQRELTNRGSSLSAYAYMAPEQRYDLSKADARADVYALGAVFFRLITGRAASDLFFAQEYPAVLDTVPEPMRYIIRGACCYDRDKRVQTMRELRAQFVGALTMLKEREDIVYPPLLPLPSSAPSHLALNSGLAHLQRALRKVADPAAESSCDPAPLSTLAEMATLELDPDQIPTLVTENRPVTTAPSTAATIWRVIIGLTGIQAAWLTALAGICSFVGGHASGGSAPSP